MPVLSVDNLTVSFDARSVLDGISFTVNSGDKIAFIGNNGAGKSTLFKAVKGVITPDDGNVLLHGNSTLGFLSQNMDEQDLSSDSLKPKDMTEVEDSMKRIEFELQIHQKKSLKSTPASVPGMRLWADTITNSESKKRLPVSALRI